MAVDIDLDRRVGGDDAQPAGDLGVIGDLLGPEDDSIGELVEVVVEELQLLVGQRQRGTARRGHGARGDQIERRVLKYFGINLELRKVLVGGETAQDGVAYAAHATLQRQELGRD